MQHIGQLVAEELYFLNWPSQILSLFLYSAILVQREKLNALAWLWSVPNLQQTPVCPWFQCVVVEVQVYLTIFSRIYHDWSMYLGWFQCDYYTLLILVCLLELKWHTVDTVSKACGWWPIWKYMTKMRITLKNNMEKKTCLIKISYRLQHFSWHVIQAFSITVYVTGKVRL